MNMSGVDRALPTRAQPLFSVCKSRSRLSESGHASGFTLIELLVALAVFAALAAAAYGGLAAIARTRGALATQQDRFASVTRSVSALARDLRQSIARPVLGNDGNPVPALLGGPDTIEFTRMGFANPRAEPRSNLERVVYAYDDRKVRRGRYAVLDRASSSVPVTSDLLDRVTELHFRYYGCDGVWQDAWPPRQQLACADRSTPAEPIPRAVEFRLVLSDLGEIRRLVEIPSSLPLTVPQQAPAP
ncbi:MAG: type II secretion system minor pseudopilin GspJ [Dokdonella sp.]|uniref:type II secretion system minor pseudopilin GspJ n=1 Tax=Dokdonella sp. TaxID=2291710 RepID=UPI0032632443